MIRGYKNYDDLAIKLSPMPNVFVFTDFTLNHQLFFFLFFFFVQSALWHCYQVGQNTHKNYMVKVSIGEKLLSLGDYSSGILTLGSYC